MNTCLQNLIHCKFFIKKLVKINQRQKINNNTPITYEFFDICNNVSNEKETIIDPSNFKKIFSKKHKEYKGYAQLDTQEFCRILLEDMNYELNEVKIHLNIKNYQLMENLKSNVIKNLMNYLNQEKIQL